ncbi:hypothetical protein D3C76_744590 [compost metagenome]
MKLGVINEMTKHFAYTIGTSLLALALLSACSSNQAQVTSGTEGADAGAVEAGQVAENGAGSSTDSSAGQQQGPGDGMMNEGQMKLMSTFRSLMMLDEQEGMGITKEQAVAILPIVQAAVTANELSDDGAANIAAELTEDQQAYMAKLAEQIPGGGRREGDQPGGGQPDGDQQGSGQSGSQGQQGVQIQPGDLSGEQGGQAPDGAGTPPEGAGSNAPDGQAPPAGGGNQGERPEDVTSGGASGEGVNGVPANGEGGPGGGAVSGPGGNIGNIGQQLIDLLQAKINGTES